MSLKLKKLTDEETNSLRQIKLAQLAKRKLELNEYIRTVQDVIGKDEHGIAVLCDGRSDILNDRLYFLGKGIMMEHVRYIKERHNIDLGSATNCTVIAWGRKATSSEIRFYTQIVLTN